MSIINDIIKSINKTTFHDDAIDGGSTDIWEYVKYDQVYTCDGDDCMCPMCDQVGSVIEYGGRYYCLNCEQEVDEAELENTNGGPVHI